MEAIILAGGLGTRLKPLIPDLPKPMAPVGGEPLIKHILNYLSKFEFEHVVLSVGYKASTIFNYFGDSHNGIKLSYAIEKSPLGTGGGIKLAMSKTRSDHVYIFNGDTLIDLEINLVEKQWIKNRNNIIVGKRVDETGRFGTLKTCKEKV